MGRLGLGVRVSASFQIFALRMLLHSAWSAFSLGNNHSLLTTYFMFYFYFSMKACF